MCDDSQQKEIIINSSNIPVIRSGFSNIIFLLLFIFLILVNQILNDFDISFFLRMVIFLVVCILTLKIYSCSIARICIENGEKLVLVGPVSQSTIDVSKIEKVAVYGIPSSMTISIMIKIKDIKLPKFYFFIAVSTNCGSYADTKIRLMSLLEK